MGDQLPPTFTPLDEHELVEALQRGYRAAAGVAPGLARLGMGWAQTALETGRGEKLRHYNVGNLIVTPSWEGDWYKLETNPRHFRAYRSAVEGAADYWSLLRRKYPLALDRFDAGDAMGAAQELAEGGYFGEDPKQVGESMRKLYHEYTERYYRDHWGIRLMVSLAAALAMLGTHYA